MARVDLPACGWPRERKMRSRDIWLLAELPHRRTMQFNMPSLGPQALPWRGPESGPLPTQKSPIIWATPDVAAPDEATLPNLLRVPGTVSHLQALPGCVHSG